MRPIKFRGQTADTKTWVYGGYLKTNDYSMIITTEETDTGIENDCEITHNIVIPETVGQLTGLLDKNGKEIYEGDIVKFPTGYTRNIIFISGCFRLRDTPYETNYTISEVIGNIYSNPDLIPPL